MSNGRRELPQWMTFSGELCVYPELQFRGEISYCYTIESITTTSAELLANINCSKDFVYLGFDSEWPVLSSTGCGKTAVIQICMSEEICYIFHVYNLHKLPLVLFSIFLHSNVKIVGLNIKNDIWKLGRDFGVSVQQIVENHCIDLAVLARKVLNTTQTWSLANLTKYLLKNSLNKSDDVRKSDWSNPLSEAQKLYAATDAYASLMCYLKLVEFQNSCSKIR